MILEEATAALNAAWVDAELSLQRLALGVSASVEMGEGGPKLAFKKHGKVWSIVVVFETAEEQKILNASRRIRVLAVEHIETLRDALLSMVDAQFDAIEEATVRLQQFVVDTCMLAPRGGSEDE